MKKFLILIIITLFSQNIFADEKLEKKARVINKKIRCVVCQSQSIDDSDSILARDLRKLIKDKLEEGQSEKEITNYLVERYGEFILLKPKFNPNTYVDISKQIKKKLKAWSCYKNETKSFPFPRSSEGLTTLAKYRGMQSFLKYAEAFKLEREII